ncbi:MAG: GxxExxY protein [Treponema sp.]|nr:GxxExxY protein [Treponema sp.]
MSFYFRQDSDAIVQCAKNVQYNLGNCFTRDVYMDALELEFAEAGLPFARDVPVPVYYKDRLLAATYRADFLVKDKIIVMVRAAGEDGGVRPFDHYALISMLNAARLNLAILIQFTDKKVQINRMCHYMRFANSLNTKRGETEFEPLEERPQGGMSLVD